LYKYHEYNNRTVLSCDTALHWRECLDHWVEVGNRKVKAAERQRKGERKKEV
jgi:hypothetical protein